jgi:ornithine cyclodeaminase/alanine dehydrogenase-like protein (mu-crystallin family)
MHASSIIVLSAKDVTKCLDMKTAISAMEDAFRQVSTKEAQAPLRTNIPVDEFNGVVLFMPAYLPETKQIALKTVTTYKNNFEKGLPMIHALVQIFDAETGKPQALMDGEVLTSLRTGAASGLATKLLANPDAETVVIFGAGIQGRTQLEAVCCVRDIKRSYIFDQSETRAQSFAEEMSQKLSIDIIPATSAADLSQADIICTATPSTKPLFEHSSLKKGVHINGIGSFRPDMCEIPPATVANAKVFVDQREACRAEAGDLIQPIDAGLIDEEHINNEIGEVALGKKEGRLDENDITFFKSVGVAVQDLAVATIILKRAKELGLGTTIEV